MNQTIFPIIKALSQIESPFGKEEKVRDYIIDFVKKLNKKYKVDKEGNLFVFGSNLWLCCHMDKLDKVGEWKEFKENIQARLDDSIGLGLMLEIIKEENVSLLCTVKEEPDKSLGAKFALNKIREVKPKLIIIIDTSQYAEKGKGPILYHSSARFNFKKEIIQRIKEIAVDNNIPLQEIKKGFHNDSMVFAEAGLPTVALEIHIDSNHTDHEVASKSDILELKKLLISIINAY
jgi:putative aminopeptidase FrvX